MTSKTLTVGAVLAVALSLAAPCSAQILNDPTSRTGAGEVAAAQERLQQMKIRLDRAATDYAHAKAQYEAGQVTQDALTSKASDLQIIESQLREAERDYGRIERDARLSQPINVELRDATVSQVAQALSEASKLPVRVDKEIPADKRLTAVASGVPTATVLSTIAKQLKLQIAPDGDRGVLLRNWPKMTVNGTEQEFVDAGAPWSDAWLSVGYAAGTKLGGWASDSSLWSNTQAKSAAPSKMGASQFGKTGTAPWRLNSGSWQGTQGSQAPLTMTSVGNQVVIAEPGPGPHGEAGVWLTVYNLRGNQLVRQSAVFHKTRAGK